jgi:hypothetical protein
MPELDTTAQSAVEGPAHAEAFFIFVDIEDDPIRITTFGQDVTFAGTGETDLDGQTFLSFDARAIEVGDVSNSENGSDTLTVTLSGIADVDAGLMADIADTTKWRGRTVRLWMQAYDETGATKQGAIVAYGTGYASSVKVSPSPTGTPIELSAENYLAAFNEASHRSYLSQSDYDSGDLSAKATLAAANMGRGAPTASKPLPGAGRGGRDSPRMMLQ